MKNIYRILFAVILTASLQFPQAQAQVTLNLKLFIQGYYTTNSTMRPVLINQSVAGATTNEVDTVTVELHDTISPYPVAATYLGILQSNGTIACSFSNSVLSNSYYIVVRHRNTLQTWSKLPVTMNATTNYDFSTSANQAYGNMEILMQANVYAFYSGDINQDNNIDLIDFPPYDFAMNHNYYGRYSPVDINGDGNIDLFDFIPLYNNINMGIFSMHP